MHLCSAMYWIMAPLWSIELIEKDGLDSSGQFKYDPGKQWKVCMEKEMEKRIQ